MQMYCSFTTDQTWVILLTSIFLCFYVGAEASTGTLIYTYVIKTGIGNETDAYLMTFVFWAALAVGRLLAIPLSTRLSGMTMLVINLIGCLLSPIIILIFPNNIIPLWVGISLYGIAMASSFPTAFVVAETMMEITGSAASLFVIGSGLGEVVIPIVVSALFGTSLSYNSVVYSMLLCAVIGFIVWWGYFWKHRDMANRGELPSQKLIEEDGNQEGNYECGNFRRVRPNLTEQSALLEDSD